MDSTALPVVQLYQIAYSEDTLRAVEPGFEPLDNRDNARPDWYEYWPIRQFLRSQALDDDAFYGFFSPKFRHKTQLGADQVRAEVRRVAAEADVVLFSPQPDMGAFFLNVFEQGDLFDPGLIEAYSAFLAHIGRPAPLWQLVMDSRQTVFSNYFVARPAFWREWLGLNEQLFDVCEGPDSALQRGLTCATTYPGGAQRKVFLQERAASLLLTVQPHWRSHAVNPFNFAWSASRLSQHPTEAVISDALKAAWRDRRYSQYLDAFAKLRERFLASGPAQPAPGVG